MPLPMGLGLLEHEPDAAAMDDILPPGGLREKTGQVGFISTVEDAAVNIAHTFVGQDDQARQIVLAMPKLTLVVKQVAEDRGELGDDRELAPLSASPSHTPCSSQSFEPGSRVAWGSQHGKSQLSRYGKIKVPLS